MIPPNDYLIQQDLDYQLEAMRPQGLPAMDAASLRPGKRLWYRQPELLQVGVPARSDRVASCRAGYAPGRWAAWAAC